MTKCNYCEVELNENNTSIHEEVCAWCYDIHCA
ncbi:hypothetical protein [Psychrobacillus phage Perkons]|nr:hypothetical protein [Psychrobacillus phage Perkons]